MFYGFGKVWTALETSDNQKEIAELKVFLHTLFWTKDLGKLCYFLGIL